MKGLDVIKRCLAYLKSILQYQPFQDLSVRMLHNEKKRNLPVNEVQLDPAARRSLFLLHGRCSMLLFALLLELR